MAYEAFRKDGGPTLYPSNKTAVSADITEAAFIYCAVILAFSLLIILPGIRGIERLYTAIRVILSVFVLASIMLVNFGQEWEVAHADVVTQYRAGLTRDIPAKIGVKIGLRSVNITLKGKPEIQVFENGQVNETVNYNERFHWNNEGFHIGRAGFGPFAGQFNQEFRAAQYKGLPYPILWVAEYFVLDGEGIRWGRHYLQAGFYTYIMVWLALPLWILSIILLHTVVTYGAYFSALTGGVLLIANILYAGIRNPNTLVIPFEGDHLTFGWGWSFWLCLFTGILCVVIGIAVYLANLFIPEALATFFGADGLQDKDVNNYVDVDFSKPSGSGGADNHNWRKKSKMPPPSTDYEDVSSANAEDRGGPAERRYRRRTETSLVRRLQRTQKKKPRPPPRPTKDVEEDDEMYINTGNGASSSAPGPRPAPRARYDKSNAGFADDEVQIEIEGDGARM